MAKNYIPGINVRQGLAQAASLVGLAPNADYDVFDNWSVAGGARSPAKGKVVGKTVAPQQSATPVDDVIEVPGSGVRPGGGGGFERGGGGYGGGAAVDPNIAIRNALMSRISGRGNEIDAMYNLLFGDLDNLLRARDAELETQYGDQLKKATEAYTGAIPEIEGSYAALGAADSTDQSDAKTKAKKGFDETTKTIGANKQKDKAALGQYGNEQRATFAADRDSAKRAVQSASETTDVDSLRGFANDLDTNLAQTGVTRAKLGTDGQARQAITNLTGDAGRFDSAMNALDSLINSSMSGSVKQAGVQAVLDAGGLSDEEKQRVQQQYGNVYAEQSAL